MATAEALELLTAVEAALVENRPFGDSVYILEQLEVTFKRRLNRIAAHLPAVQGLLDAFERADDYAQYRVVGNTVIRCAVQHAHTTLESGTPYGLPISECEKVFEETVKHLDSGNLGTPFENGPTRLERLGSEQYQPWIWTEDYPSNAFGRSFRYLLSHDYGESLSTPTGAEISMLRRGERLLQSLLPRLAPDAIGHTHLIGCFPDVGFWKGKVSSSQIRMGGVIFLSRQLLVDPWCVAEHLLHESLHQKLYDFRHGHSLLTENFSSADSPKICSIWNADELSKANHWDTHRAFAAFHVYVQLALLAKVAEERAGELAGTFGPLRGMVESRKALDRAQYLGEQLKDVCWDELGLAGQRFRDWLMTVLGFLDPAPPPKGARVHLFLDLYQKEANMVDSVLRQGDFARASLSPRLLPAAKEEIESARRVLAAASRERELGQFNSALGRYPEDEWGAQFPVLRRLIAKTLLSATSDGYRFAPHESGPATAAELTEEMVRRGSEQLLLIQTNVPAGVAGAKRRAKDHRFTKSCDDGVGRLLAVFAAALPSGGRVLEIGTGLGVGLGWITAGLGERTDAEVISIEVDPRLVAAANLWPWPNYVRILTGDASDAATMSTLGTFDLTFLDAAPPKYGRDIDFHVRMLRPGGMLVIDDLLAGPATTESEVAEKEALRRSVANHPKLRAVELTWSSGVIVASKARTSDARSEANGQNDTQKSEAFASPASAVRTEH